MHNTFNKKKNLKTMFLYPKIVLLDKKLNLKISPPTTISHIKLILIIPPQFT